MRITEAEGFEIFDKKEEKVAEAEKAEKKAAKKNGSDAKLTQEELKHAAEAKNEKQRKMAELIKSVCLGLILVVSCITMFFTVKIYYLCVEGGTQQLVFLDDVLGKNNQDGSVIVDLPDDNVVANAATTTQVPHITIVTQPNNANQNSNSNNGSNSGNTVSAGNNNSSVIVQNGDDGVVNNDTVQNTTTVPVAADDNGIINGLVNINTASKSQLMTLSGIGEVKAQAIIDYRNENGAFRSVDDLVKINGIGEKTVDKIRNYITVG